MKKIRYKLYMTMTLCCLLGGLALASVADCAENFDLMPIEEIRAGMKGIGKTVFSGTTIEEFDVEILGVLKNQTPHGDAIMAKVSGGPLPLEKSGVLAGMSGSPIYIEGKLIGALAFAFLLPKEPMIAGITPIHEMLRDADRNVTRHSASLKTFAVARENGAADISSVQMRPIQTPLFVSGSDQRVLSFMEEQLRPFHLTPVQGGGVQAQTLPADAKHVELEPGAAVCVQLVRGDMDISGVGTVTYRDGDKILAFGHPMFHAGQLNVPMSTAYVNLTVSNLMNSFKLASPLESVGAITHDWRTGIAGTLGQVPHMIPFDVTVKSDEKGSETHTYGFEVFDHVQFTSLFMKIAGFNALLSTEKSLGETTVHTRITIALKGEEPLILEDQFSGQSNPIPSILQAFAPLDALVNNPFQPIALEHVSLEISVKNELQQAEIIGARVRDNIVRAGQPLNVEILLRPHHGELITLEQSLTIPEEIHEGTLQLTVCDAQAHQGIETARAQARLQPQNVTQLRQLLEEKPGRNMIVVSLLQLKLGAVVQGRELPSPPGSMMSLINSSERSTGKNSLTRGRLHATTLIPTQHVITGCTSLQLTVNHHVTDRVIRAGELEPTFEQGDLTP